jgi:hypothetical protein
MPFQLPTHTSGISATKVPINLEAINLLLLGQNDIEMPFPNPPKRFKKKTKVIFTSTQSPVAWFTNTDRKSVV